MAAPRRTPQKKNAAPAPANGAGNGVARPSTSPGAGNGAKAKPAPLAIDFPRPEEPVSAGDYTIRIAAEGASKVEVSINGGQWQPCRASVGFFWYDWRPAEPGEYKIVARGTRGGKGRPRESLPRDCRVIGAAQN